MSSDDIDISDTSNSPKRNCRQNISDGCTAVARSRSPSASTCPSSNGRVLGLSDSARLSSSLVAVITVLLLGFDAGGADQCSQALVLGSDEGGELLLRQQLHLGAQLAHLLDHVGRLQGLDDMGAYL